MIIKRLKSDNIDNDFNCMFIEFDSNSFLVYTFGYNPQKSNYLQDYTELIITGNISDIIESFNYLKIAHKSLILRYLNKYPIDLGVNIQLSLNLKELTISGIGFSHTYKILTDLGGNNDN